jgi:enoyl-CoA hydratase/carnithine racemase
MELKIVNYEKKNGIATITMNRPEALNALSEQLHEELGWCWEDFKEDDDSGVAIITGVGRAFCAGADLKERAYWARQGKQPPRVYRRDGRKFGLPGQHEIPKPIIAAINGICVGGGHGIALDCDIRIASTAARFGDIEIKAGQIGRIDKVVRAYPTAVGMYLGLTGDMITAEQAYQWGFVSHLLEPDDLMPKAYEIAEKILANPPRAVRVYKDVGNHSIGLTPRDARDYLTHAQQAVIHSRDYVEAVTSFDEKRKPTYEGS